MHAGPAPADFPCFRVIRFTGSHSAPDHERTYDFSFKSTFSHPVYYLAYTKDVQPGAGMPYHYESFRRFGRWSGSELALPDVRMKFRRLRPGETLKLSVTRRRPFWPWRISVVFYALPDYDALNEEVESEPIPR